MSQPLHQPQISSVPDPSEIQRRASAPDINAWVAASAGSGKTKVLTDRVLRLLLADVQPGHILCLTYTKAAAAQMQSRLTARLAGWAVADDQALGAELADLLGRGPMPGERVLARSLFALVLECPGGMKFQTLHAFCKTLLERFPLEAGLPPGFTLIKDAAADERVRMAEREVLSAAAHTPAGDLGRTISFLATRLKDGPFQSLLKKIVAHRGGLDEAFRRYGSLDHLKQALGFVLCPNGVKSSTALWGEGLADGALDLVGLRAAAQVMAAEGAGGDKALVAKLAPYLADEALRHNDPDGYLDIFLTQERKEKERLCLKAMKEARPDIEATLRAEQGRLLVLLRALADAALYEETLAMLDLANAVLSSYAAMKSARGELDYTDLIRVAADLLSQRDFSAWVRYKLDYGIGHVLIDEAQDMSAEQWRIVKALTAEFFSTAEEKKLPRTIFAVGDRKQSIFGFQGAAPRLFAEQEEIVAARATEARRAFHPVPMNVSFRSVEPVLRLVDHVFNTPQPRAQAGSENLRLYLQGDNAEIAHLSFRAGHAGMVELWPPIEAVPGADNTGQPQAPPADRPAPSRRLADAIAGQIADMLERGEMLASAGRPIRPGDILILVRSRRGMMAPIIRALKQRRIPCAGVDRLELLDEIAVMDLLALADALLLPGDDFSLACVLKSPLCNLAEDELFALCHGRAGETLWQRIRSLALDPKIADGLRDKLDRIARWLGHWLERADFVRPYELFSEMLARPCPADGTSGWRAFQARLGVESLDSLIELLDQALAYEKDDAPTLQGFLAALRRAGGTVKREAGEEAEASGPGKVRLMSIHGAKGLQAPIVFFAGTTQADGDRPNLLLRSLSRASEDAPYIFPLFPCTKLARGAEFYQAALADHKGLGRAEYARLLYVALTRAADRLYIAGIRTKKNGKQVDEGWYGWIARGFDAAFGNQAHTHPAPPALQAAGIKEVRRFASEQKAQPVRAEERTKLRGEAAQMPAWIAAAPPGEARTARPFSPSRPDDEDAPVFSPRLREDRTRFRRGILIHKLMQLLPDLPEEVRATAAARLLASPAYALPPAEQAAISREVLRLFTDPVSAALFGPGGMAEVPIAGLVGDRVISGQIDRLTVVGDTVWIVDYKTNRIPAATPADVPALYIGQMRAYRALMAAIYPGRKIRAALLWTAGPRLMILPDAMMEAT